MGHTYKDMREELRENVSHRNRAFRKMKEFSNRPRNDTGKCGKTGKAGFSSIEAAQTRADEIINEGARDGITKFRIYQCEYCKQYHLTKQVDAL
jgi:hypothetical protein